MYVHGSYLKQSLGRTGTTFWISSDASHPIASFNSLQKLWNQLVVVFEPDRDKICEGEGDRPSVVSDHHRSACLR